MVYIVSLKLMFNNSVSDSVVTKADKIKPWDLSLPKLDTKGTSTFRAKPRLFVGKLNEETES